MSHRSIFVLNNNSCYMDSVLWVLFATSMPFITNKMLFARPSCSRLHMIGTCGEDMNDMNERVFLEFQALFRRMAIFFRQKGQIGDCSEFRALYRKWHQDPRSVRLQKKIPFHLYDQNEAQEFLQFVLGLYGMNGLLSFGAVSNESFFYGMDNRAHEWVYDRVDKKQSIVWNIPVSMVGSIHSLADGLCRTEEIDHVRVQHKKQEYTSVRTIHSLHHFADLLILSLERVDPLSQRILHKSIEAPPFLEDHNQKRLQLRCIICHHGRSMHSGHYVAIGFLPEEKEWFLYDDTCPHLRSIQENNQIPNFIRTNGILFFYSI